MTFLRFCLKHILLGQKIYPRYGHDRLSFRPTKNDEVTPWGKFDLGKPLKTSLVKGQGDAGRKLEWTFQDVKQEFYLLTVGDHE